MKVAVVVPAPAVGALFTVPRIMRIIIGVIVLSACVATANAQIISGSKQSLTACSTQSSKGLYVQPTRPLNSVANIPIWKTITLGEYRNVDALRSALDNSPCRIGVGDSVDEAIGRPAFPFTKTKVELDLVVLSVADLGFPDNGASLEDVYARAVALGLGLCPVDVGPVLRLKYLDQPRGEFLHIAMRPVALYNRELVDFTLGNDGAGLLLVGGDGRSQAVLPGAVKFVFVRPQPNTIARDNSILAPAATKPEFIATTSKPHPARR